jgi:antitoxin HicB
MNASEYAILIEALTAEDGGGFLATVPDLPGCMSDGETREEAARNVEDAIACWLDQARVMGRSIPSPSKALKFA